jgi:predicted MFS family arabinose efflux permease
MRLTNGLSEKKAKPQRSTAFRALRHRNYKLWFFGQGLSLIGTWMQSMAQQVLVYRLTGLASALGIVSFMTVLPLIPLALWGGSLSDRVSKRNLLLVTQALMTIQAILLAVLTWTGAVEIWHVYSMAFLLGAFKAVDTPARHSFVVEMVEDREDLTSAIGLNSAIQNGAKTLGPALAGVFVAITGEATAFMVNSLSFLAVIVSLLMMKDLPRVSIERKKANVLAHMTEGIRYVFSQQTLLILMSLVAVSSFLSKPYQTLMPVFAAVNLKESAQPMVAFLCNGEHIWLNCKTPEALPLGLLLAAVGIGAVIGALFVASLPEHARRGWVLTFGNLSFPFFLLLFVRSGSMAFSLVLMTLTGLTRVMQNAMANTLLQITAPDALRGRVMSFYSLISHGTTQLGGLQAGFVADWVGAPLSVGAGAVVSLIYGVFVALRYRQVHNLA